MLSFLNTELIFISLSAKYWRVGAFCSVVLGTVLWIVLLKFVSCEQFSLLVHRFQNKLFKDFWNKNVQRLAAELNFTPSWCGLENL